MTVPVTVFVIILTAALEWLLRIMLRVVFG